MKATIGNTNVTLDASEAVDGKVTYTYGGKTYLTAFVNENKYQFTADAINNTFTLEVLPANYTGTISAATHTFKVVDGYNVSTAKQLSILEQSTDSDRAGLWDDIKKSQGIALDQKAASVIIHSNIKMTRADMPQRNVTGMENLMYTLPESEMNALYDYPSASDHSQQLQMKSSTFLYDGAMILQYEGTGGIHGNFFSLDFSELPLVASFGNSASGDYGFDFSNACFLRVRNPGNTGSPEHGTANWNEMTNNFFINNLDVNGNSAQSERVGPTNRPVNAGGVIFFQSEHTNVTWDNVKAKACFITYLTDYITKANLNNVKSYDTYGTSFFLWSGADVTITNSNLERAGGPLLILQQTKIESGHDQSHHIPVVTIDEASQLVNLVTGLESWFVANGASQKVGEVLALNAIFDGIAQASDGAITKSISHVDENTDKVYLNLLGCVMASGDFTAITDCTVQGTMTYGGDSICRSSANGYHEQFVGICETGAPILSSGAGNLCYFDGTELQPIFGDFTNELGTETYTETPSRLVLHQGGLSMMLGLFDEAPYVPAP